IAAAAAEVALAIACAVASSAALADPPSACEIVTIAEVNAIAAHSVDKIQPRKSGNPSECGFIDARRAAVLVVSLREVKYAAENELQYERENLEKIYRSKVKYL